jgi:hypothetical protein
LDATQQNTLHTALESSKVQQQGMSQKMVASRTQLAAAVRAGDEGGIDRVSQDIANLQQQQAAIQAKTISKVYTSLRPDQKIKFEQQVNRAAGLPVQLAQRRAAGRGSRPRHSRATSTPAAQQ